MRAPDRPLLARTAALAAPLLLAGCAWFRPAASGVATPTTADTVLARPARRIESGTEAKPEAPVPRQPGAAVEHVPRQAEGAVEPRAADTAPRSTPTAAPSESKDTAAGAVLTVRLSAEEQAALRDQLARDLARAAEAIDAVKGHQLTRDQAERLIMADDFVRGARASSDTDLSRARTLAEKARVLAENLKSEVLK